MARIKRLEADVIGQIAAGEVVENPSAAIKELIENSLDAGAGSILIDIEQGGLKSIRVVDNGCGIQQEDLRIAFERHATSKLSKAEDLFRIATLGFRGEALASIAAVSKVKLTSKTEQDESALSIENIGGQIGEIKPAALAGGTSIHVREMFFNAPVRQKFMKQPKSETAKVSEIVKQAILSNPSVSFRFKADGENIYFSNGDGKIESAILSIYGVSTLKQLKKVSYNAFGVSVEGYIGVGDLSRGNRQHEHFFINGRMMKSGILSRAVEEGARQRVMIGRYPMCVLYLSMPYDTVDVNVHPNKWEVRFLNEENVRKAVEDAVISALQEGAGETLPPPLFFERDGGLKKSESVVTSTAGEGVLPQKDVQSQSPILNAPEESAGVPLFVSSPHAEHMGTALYTSADEAQADPFTNAAAEEALQLPKEPPQAVPVSVPREEAVQEDLGIDIEKIRLIGSVFNTYILFEVDDLFILCDQHAIHERILFERLMKLHSEGSISQMLLMPLVLHLSYGEYQSFLNNQGLLFECGFDAEDFGEGSVRLHGVPVILGLPEAERSFKDALDEIAQGGTVSQQKRFDRILMSACKHAIKGGDSLSMDNLMYLVKEIIDKKMTPTCPHGRPLMVSLSRKELEKRFGRIQP